MAQNTTQNQYTALCCFSINASNPADPPYKIITGDSIEITGGDCVWGGVKIPLTSIKKAIAAGWVVSSNTEEAKEAVHLAATNPEVANEWPHLSRPGRKDATETEESDIDVSQNRARMSDTKVRVRAADGDASIQDALKSDQTKSRTKAAIKPLVLGKSATRSFQGEGNLVGKVRTPTHHKTQVIT